MIPNDVTLARITPHMHLRGSGFGLEVTYPSEEQESILEVRRFDLNWQMTYELDKPKLLQGHESAHNRLLRQLAEQ